MTKPRSRPYQFVAFLRGMNVGKAKRIARADLRALVAGAVSSRP